MKKEWKITLKVLKMSGKLMALGCCFHPNSQFWDTGLRDNDITSREVLEHTKCFTKIQLDVFERKWAGFSPATQGWGSERRGYDRYD